MALKFLPKATRFLILGLAVPILAGVVYLSGSATGVLAAKKTRADVIFHKVRPERLQLTITERGTLESADNKEVVSRVKARSPNSTVATTIRWVIDDGTEVDKGDKLVQLDDSGLYEQLKTQKITLDQAYANFITADKNFEIVESQNRSDIATAKLALELAEIDMQKYEKGEYIQQIQEIEGRLLMARSDLAMWEERSA